MVCVIPVRALEAWFLLDEAAIRRASGNPNGTQDLNLPAAKHIEKLPDPKAILKESILSAVDQRRRRRRKVRPGQVLHRIAELIDDFATLRSLEAFKAFEQELVETLDRHDWIRGR